VLRLETAFYRRCMAFNAAIMGRSGLSTLEKIRSEIQDSLSLSLERIVALQGSFTLVAMLLGPQVVTWLSLPPESLPMYRVLVVAAFLGLLFQGALLVLIYLVQYRKALIAASVFLVFQTGLTWITLRLGPSTFGYGYLGACLAALGVAVPMVATSVRRLEYYAFAQQPVTHD